MPNVEQALKIAVNYGGIDGAHHKQWVIDQMVRALTDCPMVQKHAVDGSGWSYLYDAMGESDAYRELVRQACDGEEGPNTYSWDVGIPP